MKRAVMAMAVLLVLAGCTREPSPQESAQDIASSVQSEVRSSVSVVISSNRDAVQSGASGPLDLNPSPEIAKGWMTKWCQAKPGMTRAEMREIMGPPQQEFDLASGSPQMTWSAYEFMFNAFMNSDDVVRQLDANDFQLTEAEKSQIKCDVTRKLE